MVLLKYYEIATIFLFLFFVVVLTNEVLMFTIVRLNAITNFGNVNAFSHLGVTIGFLSYQRKKIFSYIVLVLLLQLLAKYFPLPFTQSHTAYSKAIYKLYCPHLSVPSGTAV